MIAEIPQALVEPLDHGQKVLCQYEIPSGRVEHPLGRL